MKNDEVIKINFTGGDGKHIGLDPALTKKIQEATSKVSEAIAAACKNFSGPLLNINREELEESFKKVNALDQERTSEYEYRKGLISDYIGIGEGLPRPGIYKEFTEWWYGFEKHGDLSLWDALSIPITEADIVEFCEYKKRMIKEELDKRKNKTQDRLSRTDALINLYRTKGHDLNQTQVYALAKELDYKEKSMWDHYNEHYAKIKKAAIELK